jgi:hypothetical protein
MKGFSKDQTGKVGDITAGLPPQDYVSYLYIASSLLKVSTMLLSFFTTIRTAPSTDFSETFQVSF